MKKQSHKMYYIGLALMLFFLSMALMGCPPSAPPSAPSSAPGSAAGGKANITITGAPTATAAATKAEATPKVQARKEIEIRRDPFTVIVGEAEKPTAISTTGPMVPGVDVGKGKPELTRDAILPEFPSAELSGILSIGASYKAILTMGDAPLIVRVGTKLGDWVVSYIGGRKVVLSHKKGGYKTELTLPEDSIYGSKGSQQPPRAGGKAAPAPPSRPGGPPALPPPPVSGQGTQQMPPAPGGAQPQPGGGQMQPPGGAPPSMPVEKGSDSLPPRPPGGY